MPLNVSNVFLRRVPPQVLDSVVRVISVIMARLLPLWPGAGKGFKNQEMYCPLLLNPVSIET